MWKAQIGVGFIGLSAHGGWAGRGHVPALRALPDRFEIRGLAASSAATAEEAARHFDIPFFTGEPEELARHPDIDLVVVTVKVPQHRGLVDAALAAGKPVYCEWPLGNGLAEAEAMATSASSRGVPSFVGLQARSSPTVRYLRDLIAGGFVGEVLSATLVAAVSAPWAGEITERQRYLVECANGATMLTIPFGHAIDSFRWVLGEFDHLTAVTAVRRETARVTETGLSCPVSAPDQVAVAGRLANGAVAAIHYRGHKTAGTSFLWEINGTEGDLIVEGGNGHFQYGFARLRGGSGGRFRDLPVPPEYATVPGDPGQQSFTVAHAYRNLWEDLRDGGRRVPTFADSVTTHRLLDAVERSAAIGETTRYVPFSDAAAPAPMDNRGNPAPSRGTRKASHA
jgi:predicted dehydrogenase